MQRLEPQQSRTGFDGAFGLAALAQFRHQAAEDIDSKAVVTRRFAAAPGFEIFAVDAEPLEEFAE